MLNITVCNNAKKVFCLPLSNTNYVDYLNLGAELY